MHSALAYVKMLTNNAQQMHFYYGDSATHDAVRNSPEDDYDAHIVERDKWRNAKVDKAIVEIA